MKGSKKSSIPSVPPTPPAQGGSSKLDNLNVLGVPENAYTPEFLKRFGERDEPVTAGEADMAGPWYLEEIPGAGWGLYRVGEQPTPRFRPYAVFRRRSVALLAAAILPGTGRDPAFHLQTEPERSGYAVLAGIADATGKVAGELTGYLSLFDENVVAALSTVELLVRSPQSLAFLQEAAVAPNDTITIQVLSGSAIVYGATIDNRTNDPSMQIARRTP